MPFDDALADRVRKTLARRKAVEKKMFGGLTFMVRGHMCVGIVKDTLMVRVGKDAYPKAVARKHARPMKFTGKAMEGFIFVDAPGLKSKKQLESWVQLALAFNKTMAAK